jgi:riboflavin biosynthesis pyrimidine reductase
MHRPWISINLAISADGKITSVARQPSGWTSPADHARLIELRQSADALMVGRRTLVADRMTLTVPGRQPQPLRCVVSRGGGIAPDHPLFQREGGPVHWLAAGEEADGISIPHGTVHRGDLAGFMQVLASDLGVRRLHCEGGGELIRLLAEMDAVDEIHLTWAGHTVFGGLEATTTTGVPAEFLPRTRDFQLTHFDPRPDQGECFLSYRRAGRDAALQ